MSGWKDALDNTLPPLVVGCTNCGGMNTHQRRVIVHFRDHEDGAGRAVTVVDGNPLVEVRRLASDSAEFEGRRDDVIVELECESCQATTAIRIMQHKGETQFSYLKNEGAA